MNRKIRQLAAGLIALYITLFSGLYKIPAIWGETWGTVTNTVPVDAYRGAGRPEASYLLERLVDLAARELDIDVLEIRRKNLIPKEVRISSYILVIATFVTLADMMLQAYAPAQHKELGAFIALIVVNCMILGRQESFSSKNSVFRSLLDAFGTGIGFTIALVMMGGFREILGTGSFLGYPLFGPNFEPWVIMVLPAGGFLTLGFILLAMGAIEQRKKTRTEQAAEVSS